MHLIPANTDGVPVEVVPKIRIFFVLEMNIIGNCLFSKAVG